MSFKRQALTIICIITIGLHSCSRNTTIPTQVTYTPAPIFTIPDSLFKEVRIDFALHEVKPAHFYKPTLEIRDSFTYLEKHFVGVADEDLFARRPELRKDMGCASIQYEYDDAGRKTCIRYFGTDGKPVINSKYLCAGFHYRYDEKEGNQTDIWYIGPDDQLMIRQDLGYAHVRYTYTEDGQEARIAYLDTEGNPVAQKEGGYASCEYKYENGNCTRGYFYDTEGALVLRRDCGYAWFEDIYDNGNCVENRYYDTESNLILRKDRGYAIARHTYDAAGHCTSRRYFDTGDRPVISTEYQCAGFDYLYNKKGNQIKINYIGPDGKLFIRGDRGFASVEYRYDTFGRLALERFYDTKGEPVISFKYHCAGFAHEYDERGNEKTVRYLGTDGRMMIRKDYGDAQTCKRYDSAGNLLEESYYDTDNKPAVWKEKGASVLLQIYENGNHTESRFYDVEGNLTLTNDNGYAIIKYTDDEAGRTIARFYYGTDGEPVFSTSDHCAGRRYRYDERGNITDIWYVGTDGSLIIRQDLGYAHVKWEYDDLGNQIKESYFDTCDNPTVSKDGGYASCKYVYDGYDCVEWHYYDRYGNPVLGKDDGFAVCKFQYDALGRCVSKWYYDIWGEQLVISRKYHCAGFTNAYDEKGNETDICFWGTDRRPMVRTDRGYMWMHKSYDDFGNLTGEAYFVIDHKDDENIIYRYEDLKKNGYLQPAIRKGMGIASYIDVCSDGNYVENRYFGPDGNPIVRLDTGYAMVKRKFDEFGQCISATYYGKDGKQRVFSSEEHCAGFRYAFDEKGNQTDTWYLGLDGKEIVRSDLGYAHIHSEYDVMNREVTVSYFDADERPTAVKGVGYASLKKSWMNGKCVTERYYSADGKNNLQKVGNKGYAYFIDIYENGKCTESRFYDEKGNPVQRWDEGYGVIKREYDALGRHISSRFYDITGERPMISSVYDCAGFRYAYDEKGNQTDTWYLDLNGNLLTDERFGYAHIHSEYNENGQETRAACFGENEALAIYLPGGYAFRENQYQNGQCVETRYYDTEGNLTLLNEEGYAIVKYEYNDLGQCIYQRYYGTDEQPVINSKYHCAGFEYQYDERGNRTYEYNLGPDGQWMVCENSSALLTYKVYDSYDELTWEGYFDYDYDTGDYPLVNRKDYGYAGIYHTYEDGKCVEIRYRYRTKENDNALIVCQDAGYAVMKRSYNEAGLLTEEAYYDTDGESLINGIDHYAMIRKEYDASGNLTNTITYDQNDEIPERL